MKNSLLTLALLACAFPLFADEVTFDFTGNNGYGMELLSGNTSSYNKNPQTLNSGVATITLKGNTRWWSANAGNQLRFYKDSSFEVSVDAGCTINEIEINGQVAKANFNVASEGGSYTTEVTAASGTGSATWSGSAQSVSFDCKISSSNKYITSIKITYVSGDVPSITPVRFSVAEGEVNPGTKVTLTCSTPNSKIYYTTDGTTPSDESTLYSEPIEINEDVTIKAIAYNEDDEASEVTTATYTLKQYTAYTSIAALNELAKGVEFKADFDATVVYAYSAYTYIYDGSNYGLIYGASNTLTPGDVIKASWTGTVDIYNNLIEFKPISSLTVDGTATVPSPREVTAENVATYLTADNQADYLMLKGVEISEDGEATLGETTVSLYKRFNVEKPSEAGIYDIVGFVAVYKEEVNFYYTEYVANPSAIGAINAETAAPATYFNLQGQKVANPKGGVFIKVQNGKSSKVAL